MSNAGRQLTPSTWSSRSAADPAIDTMLAPYRTAVAGEMDKPIGKTTDIYVRNSSIERTGEAAIGDLVADAIRIRYGTTLVLTNAGGLRAPLPSSYVITD